jgi:hypothetical protein
MICDDSKEERLRFYRRQYKNFEIPDVEIEDGNFIEKDPLDSVEKLYCKIHELKRIGELPDLILMDLFYLKNIDDARDIEKDFVIRINEFKREFRKLKSEANRYLVASGVDLLKRIRIDDGISESELMISAYTDKNFNFLSSEDFNSLYEMDQSFIYKDRDDDEPRNQISSSSEYFRILKLIEKNKQHMGNKVFITHGLSSDWSLVQNFIELKLKLSTVELAEQINKGRTIINKLEDASKDCSYAVIVMTGDDKNEDGTPISRENVMHEIGYFQGRFGLDKVCILHEQGVNIPTNLSGIAYIGFVRGSIESTFYKLKREIIGNDD